MSYFVITSYSIHYTKLYDTKFGGEGIFEHLTEKAEEKSNAIDSFFSPNEKYTMNRIDLWVGYSFVFPVQERHPFLNIAGRFYLEDYTNVSEDFYEYIV